MVRRRKRGFGGDGHGIGVMGGRLKGVEGWI